MGKGISTAVEEVFPGVPDFICHFHFLRDLGKDLLLDDYTAFQKRVRKLNVRVSLRRQAKYLEKKINQKCMDVEGILQGIQSGNLQGSQFGDYPLVLTYTLIIWIFDYSGESSGYKFSFDRPYLDFYGRIKKVHQLLGQIKNTNPTNDSARSQ